MPNQASHAPSFLTAATPVLAPRLILVSRNLIAARRNSSRARLFLVTPEHSFYDATLWRRRDNSFPARLTRAFVTLLGSGNRLP